MFLRFTNLNVCSQVLHELNKSRNWASLHVADNSCFHYRRVSLLMTREERISPFFFFLPGTIKTYYVHTSNLNFS